MPVQGPAAPGAPVGGSVSKKLGDLRPGDIVPSTRTVTKVVLTAGVVTVEFDDGTEVTGYDTEDRAVEVTPVTVQASP